MAEPLKAGKLPADLLKRLIDEHVNTDPTVLIGPEVGADAAAIRPDKPVIVVKSDPITFPTPDVASYLVNVNANDIACMGGVPRWILVTALLPAGQATRSEVEAIFRNLSSACSRLDIALVGGHTEITDAVTRPILIGMLIGEATEATLYDLRRSKPGDELLLCNTVAIEGTAILANEVASDRLSGVPTTLLEQARRLTDDPGISIVPAARALTSARIEIRGLHDPTEGGIATAILEVATVSGCDIQLSRKIPIREDTAAICQALDLDPLGLIASGALLAVVPPGMSDAAIAALTAAGIRAATIGTLTDRVASDPAVIQSDGADLPKFETDEIARFFASG